MAEEFGPGVLAPDGTLDRPALGAIVFADPDRLAALNAIVHPLVRDRSAELEKAAGPDSVVVHDVPLLTENGLAPSTTWSSWSTPPRRPSSTGSSGCAA